MTMPLWGFALFCMVSFSGWGFAAMFYGMLRTERMIRAKMDEQWKQLQRRWEQTLQSAGLAPPDPPPEMPS